MTNQIRTKVSRGTLSQTQMVDIQSEKIEMTLNTDSALASGLLIQRLTELYENPIEASVRETVSNGLDAVAIGHSGERAEIRIERPSRFNPIISIADNGPGMSYEDLKNVYSKYGASTKQDNFDQIGAYGLGAKAPLAYGTQFTVSSVNDGVKTVIIVAREEMTNYIKVISSVETDEPSGTVVSIPVNSNDIEAFNNFVSKYEENPADYDADFYIDGNKISNENWDLISEEVVLLKNENEVVKGRVWVSSKEEDIVSLFNQNSIVEEVRQMEHIIGGWSYPVPSSNRGWGNKKAKIAVELKPGLVSFNSSRDNILSNERYQDLQSKISEYLLSEEFADKILSKLNKKPLEKFSSILFSILKTKANSFLIKGTTLTIESNSNQNKHLFSLNKLVHEETGFSVQKLIKDVPSHEEGIFYTKEESHSYYKKTELYTSHCTRNSDGILMNRRTRNSQSRHVAELVERALDSKDTGLNALAVLMDLIVTESKNSQAMFITEIPSDKYGEAGSKRKSITNYMNNSLNSGVFKDTMLIYTTHTKEDMEKMLKTASVEGVKVSTYTELVSEMKEYAKQNRVKTPVQKTYQPTLVVYKNDKLNTIEVSNITTDASVQKVVVLSKDRYISASEMKMIENWYCNVNSVEKENVELYVSNGQHRVMDLEVLEEMNFEIYENKYSKDAGTSKTYQEKISGKFAEYHSVLKGDDAGEMLYIVRLIGSIMESSPTSIVTTIIDTYTKLKEISDKLKFNLVDVDKNKINKLRKDCSERFGESYSTRWGLGSEGEKQIIELISKENLELIPNITSIASNQNRSNSSVFVEITKENQIEKTYGGPSFYIPSVSIIEKLASSDKLSMSQELEKNRLEMLCKIFNVISNGFNVLVK